jgi:hypothetical protein
MTAYKILRLTSLKRRLTSLTPAYHQDYTLAVKTKLPYIKPSELLDGLCCFETKRHVAVFLTRNPSFYSLFKTKSLKIYEVEATPSKNQPEVFTDKNQKIPLNMIAPDGTIFCDIVTFKKDITRSFD